MLIPTFLVSRISTSSSAENSHHPPTFLLLPLKHNTPISPSPPSRLPLHLSASKTTAAHLLPTSHSISHSLLTQLCFLRHQIIIFPGHIASESYERNVNLVMHPTFPSFSFIAYTWRTPEFDLITFKHSAARMLMYQSYPSWLCTKLGHRLYQLGFLAFAPQ